MAISPAPRPQPPDQQARSAALDPRRSFIVQAPAGSGKTELLIQRYLTLLAKVAEPERVIAITFTRKASGEMRTRVMNALREALGNAPISKPHQEETRALAIAVLEQDARCKWNLLANPGRLRIVTIDSLSSSIVRQVPFTSRLGAAAGVTEDARRLYLQAAHATVRLLERRDDSAEAVKCALVHLENDVAQLEDLLARMLARRDQWMRHLHRGNLDELRAELETNLQRLVCTYLSELDALIPAEHKKELGAIAREAGCNIFLKSPGNVIAACRTLKRFPSCTAEDYGFWVGLARILVTSGGTWRTKIDATVGLPSPIRERLRLRDDIAPLLREIPDLLEKLIGVSSLPPCRYQDSQWEMLKAIFVLLPKALENLNTVFANEQTVDFTEIALAALEGLRGQPVESAIGHPVEHLLVDEFQDTSVSQVQLLTALTRGWDSDGAHTLFLVGDPMQSIYRFRQAEVGLFLQAQRNGLDCFPLEKLQLTANFRSQQGIVDWVNTAFSGIFPLEDNLATGAVHFEESSPVHAPTITPAVVTHPFFGADSAPREAREVVEVIEASQKRFRMEEKKGRIAVLVRARNHLLHIVEELHRRQIPFRAVEIDSLAELPIISDLVSLTRALLHLGDRVAWLAILRAPWCGLTLTDLHTICGTDLRSSVWQLIHTPPADLDPEARTRLNHFREILVKSLELRGRLPLRLWVESTWIALGGPACALTDTDLANANYFFELLAKLEQEGEVDLDDLGESVSKLFAAPDVNADDSLQLMTIHKAKGLEFEVVILPGLGRRPHHDDPRLLLWEERPGSNSATELFLAPIKPKAAEKDPLYSYLAENERKRSAEETRRVLYVATTRAKSELHLFGHVKSLPEEILEAEVKQEANSLLTLLWSTVQSDFLEAANKQLSSATIPAISAAAADPELATFRRISTNWEMPATPASTEWCPGPESKTATAGDEITYEWVGERTRQIGTVVHAFLQRIATEGLEKWNDSVLQSQAGAVRASLANRGIAAATLDEDSRRALDALRFAIHDAKGRWILSPHTEARSEFALTAVEDGAVFHIQIDRTFVDEKGIRWIIDFKSSPHHGDAERFADDQVKKYRDQLQRYSRILHKRDSRPVRVGLYFPLLHQWREWEPDLG